jgi:hypothetical protein
VAPLVSIHSKNPLFSDVDGLPDSSSIPVVFSHIYIKMVPVDDMIILCDVIGDGRFMVS